MLNLADDRSAGQSGTAIDPVVTPPIYGEHHALRNRVDFATPGWLTTLNRDPRLRVPAGFGTRVVQTQPGGLRRARLGAGDSRSSTRTAA